MGEAHPGDRFGRIGRHGELILDTSAARLLNEIRAEIKRLGNLTGVPPVSVAEDGSGRRISINVTEPIVALLSGSAGPYSFTEQSWTGSAWAALAGGRTGTNAYEVNGLTGLGGKVVRLRKTLVDDWRFQYVKLGAAVTACQTVCIPVVNCSTACLPGATVSVSSAQQVTGVTVTASGGGYTALPTLTASGGGGGTGATFAVAMALDTVTINAAGTGYAVGNTLTLAGGTRSVAATCTVTSIGAGGAITGVTIAIPGVYTALPPTPNNVFGPGTGGKLSLTWKVQGVTVSNAGFGYASAPALAFSSGAATATATAGGGTAIGSCTTIGTVKTIGVFNGGSGYTTAPILTLSAPPAGGTQATATCTVSGTGAINSVTLTNPGSGYTNTATVTITPTGGGSGAALTVTMDCSCCINVPSVQNYVATASKSGFITVSANFTVSGCSGTPVNLSPITLQPSPTTFTVHVNGCPTNLSGATVVVSQAGQANQTGTTDGSGNAAFAVVAGITATYTASYARYTTGSGSSSISGCSANNATITLAATGSNVCGCCAIPLARTLFLTDSTYGAITLAYTSGVTLTATKVVTYPAYQGCPTVPMQINYTFNLSDCSLSIQWLQASGIVGKWCPCDSTGGGPGCTNSGAYLTTPNSTTCPTVGGGAFSAAYTWPSATFPFVATDGRTVIDPYYGTPTTYALSE
jgi:hypothetical protein